MINILTQIELIQKAKEFGVNITGQTLRNYIRKGLCDGAFGCSKGNSDRGKTAYYKTFILYQAMTAKIMRTKLGKHYHSEILFSKIIFDRKNNNKITNDMCISIAKELWGSESLIYDDDDNDLIINIGNNTYKRTSDLIKSAMLYSSIYNSLINKEYKHNG